MEFETVTEAAPSAPAETVPEETSGGTAPPEEASEETSFDETEPEESSAAETLAEETEEETETDEESTVSWKEILASYESETAETSGYADTDAVVAAIEHQTEVIHEDFCGIAMGVGLLLGVVFVQGFRFRRV